MFLRKDDTEFEILEVLREAGKARLLTTDVTRIEVAKNLAEKDLEIISPIEKKAFRERVKQMLDIPLSNVNMRQLYLQAYQRHMEDIEEKTTGRCWELLTSDGINLPDIFFQYGEKSGLFSGQTKKHQFADAVVFELLKQRALVDFPVFIYSRDNDFEGVSKETENFRYANSLGDLFGLFGFGMERIVPEVQGLIESYRDLVIKSISEMLDRVSESFIEGLGEGCRTKTLDYITRVVEIPKGSIRVDDHILVFWKVIIKAQLPAECPITYRSRWEIGDPLTPMNEVKFNDGVCEINVLAKLRDYGDLGTFLDDGTNVLDGTLHLDNESGPGGYMIHPAVWPLRNK